MAVATYTYALEHDNSALDLCTPLGAQGVNHDAVLTLTYTMQLEPTAPGATRLAGGALHFRGELEQARADALAILAPLLGL